VQLMGKEYPDWMDELADVRGLHGKDRLAWMALQDRLEKIERIEFIEHQVRESLKTNSAPIHEMLPNEVKRFLREVQRRRAGKSWDSTYTEDPPTRL